MSNLQEALKTQDFVITGEVGPPKGTNLHHIKEGAELLRGKVAAINVTDIQTAVMRLGSLAVSAKLVEWGLEPVFHRTVR